MYHKFIDDTIAKAIAANPGRAEEVRKQSQEIVANASGDVGDIGTEIHRRFAPKPVKKRKARKIRRNPR